MTVLPFRRRFEPTETHEVAALDVMPEELVEELEAALDVAEGFVHTGVRLHFTHGPGGRLQLDLHDADGALHRTLTPCEALDVAAGRIAP